MGVLLTDSGRVETYQDGVVIISDAVEVLQRIDKLLHDLESIEPSVWLVQLYILQREQSDTKTLGVDVLVDFDMAALLPLMQTALVEPLTGGINARAVLEAQLNRSDTSIYARPLVLLLDGREAKLSQVDIIPVPQRSVSPEGNVETTGYTDIRIGLDVTVSIREWSSMAGSLEYAIELGEISGFVEERPSRSTREVTGTTVVDSGGVYLLGVLERERELKARRGQFGTIQERASSSSVLEIWAQVRRVEGATV